MRQPFSSMGDDVRRPVWDERGLLCYRRGGTRGFRVLVGAQWRFFGSDLGLLGAGLFSADALYPAGILRMLWRLVTRAPYPPTRVPATRDSAETDRFMRFWCSCRAPKG